MTLIVHSRNWNPLRDSKYKDEIFKLCKERGLTAIGICHIGPDDPQDKTTHHWHCHKCKHKNNKPTFEKELLTECQNPSCKYPFLLLMT